MRLLFDLDGTLTDPFVGITRCIQHALTSLGRVAPPAEDLRWCIGPPLPGSFLSLLDTADESLAMHALQLYRERFHEIGLFENEVYQGITDALGLLIERGHRLSVATSKPETFAVRIIEHFGLKGYFECVDGSELDGTRAEKSALIRHVLDRDRVERHQAMMIGDRKHDIVGALANQIASVGVLWGHGSHDELRAAGAGVLVEHPAGLSGAIEEVAGSVG